MPIASTELSGKHECARCGKNTTCYTGADHIYGTPGWSGATGGRSDADFRVFHGFVAVQITPGRRFCRACLHFLIGASLLNAASYYAASNEEGPQTENDEIISGIDDLTMRWEKLTPKPRAVEVALGVYDDLEELTPQRH